jgi:hypothetical protein
LFLQQTKDQSTSNKKKKFFLHSNQNVVPVPSVAPFISFNNFSKPDSITGAIALS